MQYRGLQLDPFQTQAIEALTVGDSVLVAAPTGTGKTVVADWMVEETLAAGHEVIYTAPIKALSNQKFRDYCKLLGEDKVGLVTGDLVIRRDAPCRVMTTEILRNMLLGGEDMPHLRAVIIDEIHFLDDEDRGTVWEEVLIYLHQRVQIVGLSATLSNLEEFSEWLSHVRQRPVRVVEERKRAVPLSFAITTREGGTLSPPEMDRFYERWAQRNAAALKKSRSSSRRRGGRRGGRHGRNDKVGASTNHIDVFDSLWPDLVPYLFFVFSRRDTESLARGLVRVLDGPLLKKEEYEEVKVRLDEFRREPGAEAALDDEIAKMLRSGVAFHHAGLHVMLKALIEELYERRLVRVLYCTGTFALGLNMPARTAVFDGLMRYNGKEMINLPGREFMQMAGRAGRRGMDDDGLVVLRLDIDDWPDIRPQLRHYLKGTLEPVRSRFSLSFNSVVNLLERHTEDRIRQLVERSFLAWFRARKQAADEVRVEELREKLESHGWTPDGATPKALKHDVKRLKRVEKRAEEAGEQTWNEFQEKVLFLQRWGYIDEDDNFNAGAIALRHIQISEIFVTEVFLEGVFDELDMPTLFGVFCGMCATLPRGTQTPEASKWRGLSRRIEAIRQSEIVLESEKLTNTEVTWDGGMIAFGRWWAEGQTLPALMEQMHSNSDASGDLVGAFRRAKDLASQLRSAWAEMPEKARQLDALIRGVTRDEVEVVD